SCAFALPRLTPPPERRSALASGRARRSSVRPQSVDPRRHRRVGRAKNDVERVRLEIDEGVAAELLERAHERLDGARRLRGEAIGLVLVPARDRVEDHASEEPDGRPQEPEEDEADVNGRALDAERGKERGLIENEREE